MQRTIRRDAATLGLEGAPAYPPPSRESTTISSTFSREATIPRSSTFLREATGSFSRHYCRSVIMSRYRQSGKRRSVDSLGSILFYWRGGFEKHDLCGQARKHIIPVVIPASVIPTSQASQMLGYSEHQMQHVSIWTKALRASVKQPRPGIRPARMR